MPISIKDTDSLIIDNRVHRISDLSQELRQLLIDKLSISTTEYIKPDINKIFNVSDFEPIAQKLLTKGTYAYYKTGAADDITLRENEQAFKRVCFKPRILNSVSNVSLKTKIIGSETDLPFYITAFYGSHFDNNTDAERPLASAAGKTNVIQMIPGLSILPLKEQVDVHANNNIDQWLQIYVENGIEEVFDLIKQVKATGNITTLVFTVDTAQLGRRETQHRIIGDSSYKSQKESVSRANLNWNHLKQIKDSTDLKIVLKGIQSVNDAIKAAEYGFDGFIISNHGGRQLDTARSSLEVLADIVPELKKRDLYNKIDILIDGGVRRGSDIVKAYALGANGVGLGRPFLYALHTYGEEGVLKIIDILKEEISLTLRLLGLTDINDVTEDYVDILDLFGNRSIGE